MENKLKTTLNGVQKTLLIPLWGRAKEYENDSAIIRDKYAHEIISKLEFDSTFLQNIPAHLQINSAIRAFNFDKEILDVISAWPDATIINIGAGLDTTFHRIDNGRIFWYDLDLEDTIFLRNQLIPQGERNKYIAKSVFDRSWFKDIKIRGAKVLIIAAGLLAYFNEKEVKGLLNDLLKEFPNSEMVFEIYSKIMLWLNRLGERQNKGKSDIEARMRWAINSAESVAKWNQHIEIINEYPFYSKVKIDEHWAKQDISSIKVIKFFNAIKMVHLKFNEKLQLTKKSSERKKLRR